MVSIKILHISDLHFDGYFFVNNDKKKYFCKANPYVTDTLKYSITNDWKDIIDAVLISGDLTCLGLDKDLNKAYRWIDEVNRFVPTVLLPGNHDRYEFDVHAYPASIEFDNIFHQYWGRNKKVQVFQLPRTTSPRLSVICSDFTLKNKSDSTNEVFGRYGQGKVYQEILVELDTATRLEKTNGLAVLWMIHFSPEIRTRPFKPFKKYKSQFEILIDAKKFLQKANNLGVEFILCGHTHKKSLFNPKKFGNIEIHCSGTSGCIHKDCDTSIHFRTILIDNNNDITKIIKEDFEWMNDRFVPV